MMNHKLVNCFIRYLIGGERVGKTDGEGMRDEAEALFIEYDLPNRFQKPFVWMELNFKLNFFSFLYFSGMLSYVE